MKPIKSLIQTYPYRTVALIQSLIATVGSLFLSQVWLLVPCELCWFQRIFMYPLPFILGIGLIRRETKLYQYVLPLSLIGLTIAAYHTYLYYYANYSLNGANETVMIACSGGVSCTNQLIEWFGFITVPLLSFLAFSVITLAMLKERHDSI
ncbi:hypothetical protein A2W24_03035 [Microgenomates group bacterium RBG_16_45_19]|nr:MAG: hypothetical protein A2W24_03035 [Microgenomates group bacterium RBG_16_45_19]